MAPTNKQTSANTNKLKFLSYGDRWELCWFFESSQAAVAGERSVPLRKREAAADRSAAAEDPDGGAVERLELAEIRNKVAAILGKLVADAPDVPFPPGFTRGENRVWQLFEGYVLPGVVNAIGNGPNGSGPPAVFNDGQREVYRLRDGTMVQVYNLHPVNAPPDAIPGLVCATGLADYEQREAELADACAAYRAAREALGFPERGHERAELLSAHAAQLAEVERSTMVRSDTTLPARTLAAKRGERLYTTLTVTSDDALDAEKKETLERFLQRIREMTRESEARIAHFTRMGPSK